LPLASRDGSSSHEELGRLEGLLTATLAADTGQKSDVVARDVSSERELDASAARAYGLIDSIEA
jgi:ATP-dependent protease ClpP protease subunit